MTTPSKLADRLVEKVFGSSGRGSTPQEVIDQTPAKPPRSVIAQLAEGRKKQREHLELLRKSKVF
ncbi:hypothetical protein LCGC14_0289320 [marine sediment metagenome]|uniref:Uncharacterized protein n=1 Tax=marine sediment metagenome TaxID=412755 RepID=A0A0F9TTU7_9ZZZZ